MTICIYNIFYAKPSFSIWYDKNWNLSLKKISIFSQHDVKIQYSNILSSILNVFFFKYYIIYKSDFDQKRFQYIFFKFSAILINVPLSQIRVHRVYTTLINQEYFGFTILNILEYCLFIKPLGPNFCTLNPKCKWS